MHLTEHHQTYLSLATCMAEPLHLSSSFLLKIIGQGWTKGWEIFFSLFFFLVSASMKMRKGWTKILSFLFFSSRQWGGQTTTHTFFFCIHHTPFYYFMPMPLILFVLSQHFMTQINIFYLCHTYAIISIKKIAQLLIMPIMAGHLVLRWEIWHANPPISY